MTNFAINLNSDFFSSVGKDALIGGKNGSGFDALLAKVLQDNSNLQNNATMLPQNNLPAPTNLAITENNIIPTSTITTDNIAETLQTQSVVMPTIGQKTVINQATAEKLAALAVITALNLRIQSNNPGGPQLASSTITETNNANVDINTTQKTSATTNAANNTDITANTADVNIVKEQITPQTIIDNRLDEEIRTEIKATIRQVLREMNLSSAKPSDNIQVVSDSPQIKLRNSIFTIDDKGTVQLSNNQPSTTTGNASANKQQPVNANSKYEQKVEVIFSNIDAAESMNNTPAGIPENTSRFNVTPKTLNAYTTNNNIPATTEIIDNQISAEEPFKPVINQANVVSVNAIDTTVKLPIAPAKSSPVIIAETITADIPVTLSAPGTLANTPLLPGIETELLKLQPVQKNNQQNNTVPVTEDNILATPIIKNEVNTVNNNQQIPKQSIIESVENTTQPLNNNFNSNNNVSSNPSTVLPTEAQNNQNTKIITEDSNHTNATVVNNIQQPKNNTAEVVKTAVNTGNNHVNMQATVKIDSNPVVKDNSTNNLTPELVNNYTKNDVNNIPQNLQKTNDINVNENEIINPVNTNKTEVEFNNNATPVMPTENTVKLTESNIVDSIITDPKPVVTTKLNNNSNTVKETPTSVATNNLNQSIDIADITVMAVNKTTDNPTTNVVDVTAGSIQPNITVSTPKMQPAVTPIISDNQQNAQNIVPVKITVDSPVISKSQSEVAMITDSLTSQSPVTETSNITATNTQPIISDIKVANQNLAINSLQENTSPVNTKSDNVQLPLNNNQHFAMDATENIETITITATDNKQTQLPVNSQGITKTEISTVNQVNIPLQNNKIENTTLNPEILPSIDETVKVASSIENLNTIKPIINPLVNINIQESVPVVTQQPVVNVTQPKIEISQPTVTEPVVTNNVQTATPVEVTNTVKPNIQQVNNNSQESVPVVTPQPVITNNVQNVAPIEVTNIVKPNNPQLNNNIKEYVPVVTPQPVVNTVQPITEIAQHTVTQPVVTNNMQNATPVEVTNIVKPNNPQVNNNTQESVPVVTPLPVVIAAQPITEIDQPTVTLPVVTNNMQNATPVEVTNTVKPTNPQVNNNVQEPVRVVTPQPFVIAAQPITEIVQPTITQPIITNNEQNVAPVKVTNTVKPTTPQVNNNVQESIPVVTPQPVLNAAQPTVMPKVDNITQELIIAENENADLTVNIQEAVIASSTINAVMPSVVNTNQQKMPVIANTEQKKVTALDNNGANPLTTDIPQQEASVNTAVQPGIATVATAASPVKNTYQKVDTLNTVPAENTNNIQSNIKASEPVPVASTENITSVNQVIPGSEKIEKKVITDAQNLKTPELNIVNPMPIAAKQNNGIAEIIPAKTDDKNDNDVVAVKLNSIPVNTMTPQQIQQPVNVQSPAKPAITAKTEPVSLQNLTKNTAENPVTNRFSGTVAANNINTVEQTNSQKENIPVVVANNMVITNNTPVADNKLAVVQRLQQILNNTLSQAVQIIQSIPLKPQIQPTVVFTSDFINETDLFADNNEITIRDSRQSTSSLDEPILDFKQNKGLFHSLFATTVSEKTTTEIPQQNIFKSAPIMSQIITNDVANNKQIDVVEEKSEKNTQLSAILSNNLLNNTPVNDDNNNKVVNVNTVKIIEHIANNVQPLKKGGKQEIILRLDPPTLGEIKVKISSDQNGIVTANIEAVHSSVRDSLAARIPELRQALQDAGLSLDKCQVSLSSDRSFADQFTNQSGNGRWQNGNRQQPNVQETYVPLPELYQENPETIMPETATMNYLV